MLTALALAPPPAHAQQQHRVACPIDPPAEWKMAEPAPLNQAAVLSQPVGEPIDESPPPSLAPDQAFARGYVWHNVWVMGDEPGWARYIDCQYRGSKRILRLKAGGMKQCEQTAQPYSAKQGVADNAVQTMTCD
ncbi:MAG TPA: STY0301 family protein [Acetobacteraceae bacterium]|nr:STY0301 family protein [Acetobacteraceae bacterium]